jgi:OmpA-OmpF porin, OOP family
MRSVLLAASLCMITPAVAGAQVIAGPYVGGSFGLNFAGSPETQSANTRFDTNPGPVVIGAAGWGFGNGLRLELEGSLRSNSADHIETRRTDGALDPLADQQGSLRTYAAMVNVAYDVPISPFGLPVHPYVGGGLGYAWLDLSSLSGTDTFIFRLPQNNTVTSPAQTTYSADGAFAGQVFVGLSAPLPIRGLTATLEYRFFATAHISDARTTTALGNNTFNGSVPSSIGHSEVSLQEHSILLGLRYNF